MAERAPRPGMCVRDACYRGMRESSYGLTSGRRDALAGGAARPTAGGDDARWNFDEAIAKCIDLSYHDGKGGDTSTAVRHWRRFCGDQTNLCVSASE